MTITFTQLRHIYQEAPQERLELYLPLLNSTMEASEIDTLPRKRMFLAQIGHESGQLRYTEEIDSGDRYEFRLDLGNTSPGDGKKYKGRGLIQLTGKRNYALCGLALDLPLLDNPSLLSSPQNATQSAGWWWKNNMCNALCDLNNYRQLSYRINGGREPKDPNGWNDRVRLYHRALESIQ